MLKNTYSAKNILNNSKHFTLQHRQELTALRFWTAITHKQIALSVLYNAMQLYECEHI